MSSVDSDLNYHCHFGITYKPVSKIYKHSFIKQSSEKSWKKIIIIISYFRTIKWELYSFFIATVYMNYIYKCFIYFIMYYESIDWFYQVFYLIHVNISNE